jgi:HK97 family phage prohead protease
MENNEVRFNYKEAKIEVRKKEADSPEEIFGYGAVFNSDSDVLFYRGKPFVERILPGAFDHLLDDPNIVSLFNHSEDFPLARNKRSMTIGVDEFGLWYRFNPPNSPLGQNVSEGIKRGDIVGSSFTFAVSEKNEKWEMRKDKPALRTISKIDVMVDLGPVTFNAYPKAMVTSRSIQIFNSEDTFRSDLAEMDLSEMKYRLSKGAI